MNYQKMVCWGDSQTYGARTYGCYPLYLSQALNLKTRYTWQVLNLSANGHTARDLWFRLTPDLGVLHDVHWACVLIGTNDVGNASPPEQFEEYYKQILSSLAICRFRAVFCGEIPPLWADGHAFFPGEASNRRATYNDAIRRCVAGSEIARLVEFPLLTQDSFCDPVHFSESGNQVVADAFASAIMQF